VCGGPVYQNRSLGRFCYGTPRRSVRDFTRSAVPTSRFRRSGMIFRGSGYLDATATRIRGPAMNEHRLHHTWSMTDNITARRRRARAASRRLARMRARIAQAHASTGPLLTDEPARNRDAI
jgi:hypothetical protein